MTTTELCREAPPNFDPKVIARWRTGWVRRITEPTLGSYKDTNVSGVPAKSKTHLNEIDRKKLARYLATSRTTKATTRSSRPRKSPDTLRHEYTDSAEAQWKSAANGLPKNYFNPKRIEDQRKRTMREIAERSGQQKFRNALLRAFGGCCAVTRCNAVEALEAAHISPYLGEASHHVTNGLLLRADIHRLFDLHLIAIDPHSLMIELAKALKNTSYAELNGRLLHTPDGESSQPNKDALDWRWRMFRTG